MLKDKVAVITGASQGLGEALAIRLSDEGCKVVVADLNYEGAQNVAAQLKDAIAVAVDVTKYEDCEAILCYPCSVENFSGFHLQDKHNASYFFQNVVTDRCLSYAKLIIIFWIKAITAYNNILLCLEN